MMNKAALKCAILRLQKVKKLNQRGIAKVVNIDSWINREVNIS